MVKSIIAPIIATLAIVVQFIFGVEIPEEVVNETVVVVGNVIAVGTVIYGILTSPKKPIDKK